MPPSTPHKWQRRALPAGPAKSYNGRILGTKRGRNDGRTGVMTGRNYGHDARGKTNSSKIALQNFPPELH